MSCEKWELIPGKLNGTFTSGTIKLADLDSVQFNLVVTEGNIQRGYLNPSYIEPKYLFEVDSICNNTVMYFHFVKEYNLKASLYYGILEIEDANSKNYEFIGYLKISDRWEYVLYFK